MNKLLIGVNTAMFDGLEADVAFRTIKQAGFRYVELAYNQGYVGDMPPALFGEKNAFHIRELLDKHQLRTHSLGATMNIGALDAVEQFSRRIRFANMIGAKWINACVGRNADRARIIANLRELASVAYDNGCVICLENGGDPNYDVFRLANDGFELLDAVGSKSVAFNVDAGNIVSLCPDADPIEQAIAMLPGAQHCHLKDLQVCDGEVHFTPMGYGQLNYVPMLKELAALSIPCSLEIPLRMHRRRDSYPVRGNSPVDPLRSLEVLIQSREMLEKWLGYELQDE
ncbi:sugar phosphate isomerase/epimerase [Citrobacter amalonaticus]|uniref:Sugar phosphate isomerase/epimerase n=1 Tax=Citrobacter amalonaticus TaxID=35703 RepID=A0A2S4RS69_CITAM|nr:sugar phosphate isomerase/epimerase family protein [Citrobacter amalonaticus]POT55698.1 sugar phosphate isomerase/epimerase [Citrobacter amalonaticus]POT73911.1 sugar phosphate isomerase/epimerase [Citrobacter amalonaticus]POU62316.1 sugar phosphate isomerase/epimerase [Citrobacter amalonaticus]POV02818.1 sugar phosphate isomerase/epimerase [Citrobacter amalonaticus]